MCSWKVLKNDYTVHIFYAVSQIHASTCVSTRRWNVVGALHKRKGMCQKLIGATITNIKPNNDTVTKMQSTISATRHQVDNNSKATKSTFPSR